MNVIEKVITGYYTEKSLNENGKEIEETKTFNFYQKVRMSVKIQFVNNVVDIIVTDTTYVPILRDLIFDIMLVQYFTDIDVSEILESKNAFDNIEEYLNSTNIVETIKKNMDAELLKELNDSVDFDIQYKTGVHNNDISRSIGSLLKTLENQIKDIDAKGMMALAEQLTNVTDGLTTDKIVDAYSKTEMFKGHQEEIVEAKNKKIRELEEIIEQNNKYKHNPALDVVSPKIG